MLEKRYEISKWICTKLLNLYFLSCESRVNFVTVFSLLYKILFAFYSKSEISRRLRYIKLVYITTSNRQIRALLY
jgi:hypothetical protein